MFRVELGTRRISDFNFSTGQAWCLIIEEELIVPFGTTWNIVDNLLLFNSFRSISPGP